MFRLCWHKWSNWTTPSKEYDWCAQYSVCSKCGLSKRKSRFLFVVSPDIQKISELYARLFGDAK